MTVHPFPLQPRPGLELARRVVRSKHADRKSLEAAIRVLSESPNDLDQTLAAELRKVGYTHRDPLPLLMTSVCAAWLVLLLSLHAVEAYWTEANARALDAAGVL